jgi:hypothetical protein
VDLPYQESYGAAAIVTKEHFQDTEITSANSEKIPKPSKSQTFIPHPNKDQLTLLVIKGTDMMTLVHKLYRMAADEA